jgi:hypothetical protein
MRPPAAHNERKRSSATAVPGVRIVVAAMATTTGIAAIDRVAAV